MTIEVAKAMGLGGAIQNRNQNRDRITRLSRLAQALEIIIAMKMKIGMNMIGNVTSF